MVNTHSHDIFIIFMIKIEFRKFISVTVLDCQKLLEKSYMELIAALLLSICCGGYAGVYSSLRRSIELHSMRRRIADAYTSLGQFYVIYECVT